MKKLNLLLALLVLLIATIFVGCLKDQDNVVSEMADHATQQNAQALQDDQKEADVISYSSQFIPGQYIVVYKDDALTAGRSMQGKSYEEKQRIMKEEVTATLQRNNVLTDKVTHVYGTAIKGFGLKNATEQEIEQLRRDEQIKYIEQDQVVTVSMGGPPGSGGGGGGQTEPWGIDRVNGGAGTPTPTGRAWIIDSGIDLDHPDLKVASDGVNFANGNGPNDGNGHGTHVAGTVAAKDNSVGVIGVAPGAEVVPVRVLGNSGSGSWQGVIAGVDYVAANAAIGDVANMSLGGGYNQAVNDAVENASGKFNTIPPNPKNNNCNCAIPFALAAGNESTTALSKSPASADGPDIYTIASMTSSNGWSSFSNYGKPPVDWIAPGSSILSTYKGGGYATLSGTSMASPHVCGILLLGYGISSDGGNVTKDGEVYDVAVAVYPPQ